jgi:hypothetical protein
VPPPEATEPSGAPLAIACSTGQESKPVPPGSPRRQAECLPLLVIVRIVTETLLVIVRIVTEPSPICSNMTCCTDLFALVALVPLSRFPP